MKKFKFEYKLLLFYITVCSTAFLSLLLFPYGVLAALRLSGFFFILALLFILPPVGRIRLFPKNSSSRYSMLTIIGLQLALGLCFTGFAAIVHENISWTSAHTEFAFTQQTFRSLLIDWGLYPWPLYAVLACGVAYYQQQDEPASLRTALQLRAGSMLGLGVDLFTRQSAFWALGLSIGIASTGFAQWIANGMHWPLPSGLQLRTFLVIMPLFLLIGSQLWITATRYLWEKQWSMGSYLLVFMTAMISLILLLNILSYFVANHLAPFSFDFFNSLTQRLVELTPLQRWRIMSWLWWLAWAPLIAPLLARLAKGYTIRTFVLATLFFPFLITSIGILSPHLRIAFAQFNGAHPYWFALVGTGLIIIFLRYNMEFKHLVITTTTQQIPGDHHRLSISVLRGVLQLTSLITLVYLAFGIAPIYFVGFILLAPCFGIALAVGLNVYGRLLSKTNTNL